MPDRFELPTTPEQWAAVKPNERDAGTVQVWMRAPIRSASKCDNDDTHLLAAASRLLERERCVERLAKDIVRRGDTLQPGHQPTNAEATAEARRILEDK